MTGNDDGGELETVALQVDEGAVTTLSEAPFEFEWDTTELEDGEYTLSFFGTNSYGDEADAIITAFVQNCECNRNADVCDAVEAESPSKCECDPDCDDADPCIADSVCDGTCPAGTDPDCDCDDIPIESEAGQFCIMPGTSCFNGRCVTSDLPFGTCRQLCSPGSCEEICDEGVSCQQEYTGEGEPERFEDGRLLGICGFSFLPGSGAYDECDSVANCRDGDLCLAVGDSGANQCLQPCNDGTVCPSRDGSAGTCGYRSGDTFLCGLPCSPEDPFSFCPSGMSCYELEGGAGICHW